MKRAFALLMCLCLLLSGCAGTPETSTGENTTGTPGAKVEHKVTLVSEGGRPLQNVGIFIYADAAQTDLVAFERTDGEGIIRFQAVAGGYIAVLQQVPAGHKAAASYDITQQETRITLATTLAAPAADTRLGLGDVMCELTVTTVDGQEMALSQLLQEKKMVMLNFWYLGCPPCNAEFPLMQQAYEGYSADIEILALNPVDSDTAAIAQRWQELEMTIPSAACEGLWNDIFQLKAFPTTVVIDRFGTICMIHEGALDEVQDFADIFDFFTAEDYVPALIESMDQLTSKVGSAERPFEHHGAGSFQISLEAGVPYYCDIFKVNDLLTITGDHVQVTYGQQSYETQNGAVTFPVAAPDTYSPARLVLQSQTGQTVTLELKPKPGTLNNPFVLELGSFASATEAENNQGIYYLFTAEQKGQLTVQCTSCTAGVSYEYVLYNLSSGSYVNCVSEDGDRVSIAVEPGDQVQLSIAAVADAQGNAYPAASFESLASFAEQEEPKPTDPQPTEPAPTEPAPTEPEPQGPINVHMEYTELYVGNAYHVGLGTTAVELLRQDVTYFLFAPTEPGLYRFSASAPLRYYSNNIFFIMDHTSSLEDFENNSFTVSIKADSLEMPYLISLEGSTTVLEGTVAITRLGDPLQDIEDLPDEIYVGKHTPSKFTMTLAEGQKLEYVDVAGATTDFQPVLGDDGCYHLNSKSGPLLYINLGADAPFMSMKTMLSNTGMRKYYYDSNGNFVKKVDFTGCMKSYIDCIDEETGLYPLTEDLIFMIREHGGYVGWWDNGPMSSYLFHDVPDLNTEIAWMFAVCYAK